MRASLKYEEEALSRGYQNIAGVDEAGRGPLAGPVVAAACIFPPGMILEGVKDSKKLSSAQREKLAKQIRQQALAVGVGIIDHEEIDRINILQATLRAMVLAVEQLPVVPGYVFIDGNQKPPLKVPSQAVVGGDRWVFCVAAASIIAKVERDHLMDQFHQLWPEYGFDRNRGYGTEAHRKVLHDLGPSPIHRKSFKVS